MRHWCLLALCLSIQCMVRAQSVDRQTLMVGVPIDATLDHGQTHRVTGEVGVDEEAAFAA